MENENTMDGPHEGRCGKERQDMDRSGDLKQWKDRQGYKIYI
jgi:hypothetical protein